MDIDLTPYGYAPGGYVIKCHHCGRHKSDLDKRATCCLECAIKRVLRKSAALEARITGLEAWAFEADSMLARAHSEIAWAEASIRSYSNKMPGGRPPEIMSAISELRGRLTDIVEIASGGEEDESDGNNQ